MIKCLIAFLLLPSLSLGGPVEEIIKGVVSTTYPQAKPEVKEVKKSNWQEFLPKPENVPNYLQDISVTIKSDTGSGSGVLKTRKSEDGKRKVTFIWTAAHVVDGLKKQRTVIDPSSGTPRTIVEFGDAKVVKEIFEDGRNVGRLELDAEVIRYSDAEAGEDLALLRLRKKNFIDSSAIFYLEGTIENPVIPPLGTKIYHVGSLHGQIGSNSMTSGIVSQHGRILTNKKIFDQCTAPAFPGSSGGGNFLENGAYIGMLVRGVDSTFTFIVPVRRMRTWAKVAKVEWALDDNIPLPSEEDLVKLPVEEVGKTWMDSIKSMSPKLQYKDFLYRNNDKIKTLDFGL